MLYLSCFHYKYQPIMTMHLAHPALTTMGKRKGKVKFRNAEEARKARELAQEWERNQAKWSSMSKPIHSRPLTRPFPKLGPPPGRSTTDHIKSLDTGVKGAVTSKQSQQYTGDNVLGITIMHKSCLQPVFSQQAAIDAANMRRG